MESEDKKQENEVPLDISSDDAHLLKHGLSKEFLDLPTNKLDRHASVPSNISTSVKIQDLPEFRAQHSLIETFDRREEKKRFEEAAPNYNELKVEKMPSIFQSMYIQEYASAAKSIWELLRMRDKYHFEHCQYKSIEQLVETKEGSHEPMVNYLKDNTVLPKLENTEYRLESGVFIPCLEGKCLRPPIKMSEFLADLTKIIQQVYSSSIKSFSYKRLHILEKKFEMHILHNREKEIMEQKLKHQRDFYKVKKVDTHIHHSACMDVNLLLKYIKRKAKEEPERDVFIDAQTKQPLKLYQIFERYELDPEDLNVEILDMHAGNETFERFDRFNKKYNPFNKIDFRDVFLKSDNYIEGQYLAEITKEVFNHYDLSKSQFYEPRISIYGKNPSEWKKLANWFDKYELYHPQVRWLIQIPRLYEAYKKAGVIKNFQEMLSNIFGCLFEVTINPESNPQLYKLLLQVVGFDSVDDESIYELGPHATTFEVSPENWDYPENPHYCYWAYYLWANIHSLNQLRKARGLNSFAFRPHSGEAGSFEHLMGTYLLADSINHGIRLPKAPVLQYLYYLKQIGLAVSPLSNNKLFKKYKDNPFPKFFAIGMNVSLSTDDPLIFHMTSDSLMEEYSIASQIYELSTTDLCEIAKNSVLQSGFEEILKKNWLGDDYHSGNAYEKTNIPNIRFMYRKDTLKAELKDLETLMKYAT